MRVLVTGSNGFVGRAVVADARQRGWQVVGLGRAPRPTAPVDDYVRHDLARPLAPDAVPGDVDAVIHCAGLSSPWARSPEFVAANVDGTRHLIRWARAHGRPHVVHVSSTSVLYRDADQFDLTERSPVVPDAEQINVYARTKAIGERVAARYDGDLAVLRPRAVFGVGDTVLLPRILRLAQGGVLPRMEDPARPVTIDLVEIHTCAHYLTEAVARRTVGTYNLTNAAPVQLYPFVLEVLDRLGAQPRTVRVSPRVVRAVAALAEQVSATLLDWREPPITRFGVSVLSRSKTFDVRSTVRDLGAPSVSLDEGVRRIVHAYS